MFMRGVLVVCVCVVLKVQYTEYFRVGFGCWMWMDVWIAGGWPARVEVIPETCTFPPLDGMVRSNVLVE